jgi:hypothetical protein
VVSACSAKLGSALDATHSWGMPGFLVRSRSLVPLFCLAALGCGKDELRPAKAPAPSAAPPAVVAPASPVPEGHLDRRTLDQVLRAGPPWLLERVQVEEVMKGGKFAGWRVRELTEDLRGPVEPGDVVTAVNGKALETPNDFWDAWTSLSVASEIRISVLRDGAAHEVTLPIFGAPDPAVGLALQAPPPPRRPEAQGGGRPRQKPTIVIREQDRPLTDTIVDPEGGGE